MDDVTRGHIRNIDSALTRLASSVTTGREELLREIRGEIKLLAKTIATAGAGEPTSSKAPLVAIARRRPTGRS